MNEHKPFLAAFFRSLVNAPRLTVCLGLLLILGTATGLTRLYKDTSVDAFIPADHPSLLANDRTAEVFGLTEPIAVAVMAAEGESIFNARALALIADLTEAISDLPNVRADRVVSLATESSIRGEDGSLLVDAYLPAGINPPAIEDLARRWRNMPPHVNSLVAADESGAVIMAELVDSGAAAETYEAVQQLVAALPATATEGHEILIAGPGAVSGFLSSYIDQDARVLQPVVFLLIMLFLYVAFRSGRALLGPLLVVAGSAGGALGVMAWQGVAYFAITNALPVILVSISVADAIHVLSAYYQLRARRPSMPLREAIVLTMTEMSRPITLTTLTTMAGFVGIGVASIMPPIQYFAWYATLGVALAWLFSIVVLPAVMMLLRLQPSPAFSAWRQQKPDRLGELLARIGAIGAAHPGQVLAVFAGLLVFAALGAAQLRVDRSQVENFATDEPIRIADERINEAFAGTAFLDVIVDVDGQGDLLERGRMQGIAELQAYMETLPHVAKTVSIVDYLSLLHYALEERTPAEVRLLPEADGALYQYLLVYEASGDPTDFEEEIDPEYQTALVRGVLDTPLYSDSVATVEALEAYLETGLAAGLKGTVAGDVNVSYHWMSRLEATYFVGVGLSLVLVLIMSMLAFRSVGAGLVSVVPVAFTVLLLYGLMGYLDIYLEPATSMFAAISVGVGVDFAIHLVDRLRLALRLQGGDLAAAVALAMPGTARACFFNASALGVGFSVLLLSDLPMLQRFGGLVSVAAFASFLCALIIVPALYAAGLKFARRLSGGAGITVSLVGLAVLTGAILIASPLQASQLTGIEVAERVAARAEGEAASRTIQMTLTDRRGRVRQREAIVLKLNEPTLDATRISYLAPKSVRGVTFLSRELEEKARDDRWLYLPATRKVRRIPASDRGDYFLGTDFTYEDVQSDLKFDVADYRFRYEGSEQRRGALLHHISGDPVSQATARALGYGAFEAWVDPTCWMPVEIRFFDLKGQALKTIHVRDVRQVSGIWTAHEVEAVNHRTGHETLFRYRAVSYPESLPADYFDSTRLSQALPGAAP